MRLEQNDNLQNLEQSLLTVMLAFANSPDGGVFFLKYILIHNSPENVKAVQSLYNKIAKTFGDQKELADSVIKALKFIRSFAMESEGALKELEQQIQLLIEHKAITDYCKDKGKEEFSDIFSV